MKAMSYKIASLSLILLLPMGTPITAQLQNPSAKDNDELTMLTVTVRNRSGNFVMGVPRESFELTDDKETRAVEYFENSDSPMSLGLLVDTSESMQLYETKDITRPAAIGQMISRFLELSNPKNEYFVLAFDQSPRVVTDWESSQQLLAEKIELKPEKRDTSLYDSCFAGLEKLASAHHSRRALILFTDGEDNFSKSTFVQLREQLRRSDVPIYSVGVAILAGMGSTLGMEGSGVLTEFADVTGGEALFGHDAKEVRLAIEALAIELRHQYRLGFRPPGPSRQAKWHRLKLKINSRPNAPEEFSKLTVRTRAGYYSR